MDLFYCQNLPAIAANTMHKKVPVLQKPNSSSFLVGQKDVLDKLWNIFIHSADSELSRCSCLLWGTGGIGKTQICLRFVEELSDRGLSHVFWVDASSEESIVMSLRGIFSISAAQASCLDDSVKFVLQRMLGIQEEWLIVFDNADVPPDVVEKFIPPGNRGNILITSQSQSMGRVLSSANIIEISEMEETDAITLLLRASCLYASAEHREVAKNIVTELGCIPLAVDQAGAYIEAGRCSIDKYLQQLSLHHQALMFNATFKGASKYDQAVYETWDLSFEEIKRRASGQSSAGDAQAAHAAILILQICVFFHHSNISKDIFRFAAEESREPVVDSEVVEKLPLAMSSLDRTLLALDNNGHWDESIFEQGITVLLSFSLMKKDESSGMLSVHPLVHHWSREQLSKSEQQRMYEIGSIILCCAISPRLSSYDYGLRQLIFLHIKANESYGSQMGLTKKYYDDKWNKFIFVIREIGDWKHTEQLEVQVLDMRKKLLGAEHPRTLLSMENLVYTYLGQEKWNEAEQLGIQVLDMRKKVLGAEHPHTLLTMGNLAYTYLGQGKWDKAEQIGAQVLDIKKKVLGAEHLHTLLTMGNLAYTLLSQEKWYEAEQLGVQVLAMKKKLLSAEHPYTLISMNDLANVYLGQRKWNEAELLGLQALDMSKKRLGAEHVHTLRCMGNLAVTYSIQGKWDKAEQLGIQVLDMKKKLLGAEHPHTLISMRELARTYYEQRKWNNAEQLEVQVLDISKKLFGAKHPNTLLIMVDLARTYADRGKLNEAEQLEVQVLDMRKKLLGEEHPDTLESMRNLAYIYSTQGKWDEADQLEGQVLDIWDRLRSN